MLVSLGKNSLDSLSKEVRGFMVGRFNGFQWPFSHDQTTSLGGCFAPPSNLKGICWAHSEGHPRTEGTFTGTLVNVTFCAKNAMALETVVFYYGRSVVFTICTDSASSETAP